MNNVGARIQRLRKSHKPNPLSQKELAAMSGWDASNLSKLERGEYTWTEDNLRPIVEALKVPISSFFTDEPEHLLIARGGKPVPILKSHLVGLPSAKTRIIREKDVDGYLFVGEENTENLFGLRVRDNSMVPRLRRGDAVLLDRTISPLPGDIVAVEVNKARLLRKYRPERPANGVARFKLVALNEDYPPLFSDDEAEHPVITGVLVEQRRYRRVRKPLP